MNGRRTASKRYRIARDRFTQNSHRKRWAFPALFRIGTKFAYLEGIKVTTGLGAREENLQPFGIDRNT